MMTSLGRDAWKSQEAAQKWKSAFENDPVGKYNDKFERKGVGDFISAFSDLRKRNRVIDVGCGQGKYFIYFGQSHLKIGVDISSTMLRVCKTDFPDVNCVVADAEHLPFTDGLFDIVLCTRTLQHMSNQNVFLLELSRILSNNGSLFLLFYNALTFHCLYKNICSSSILRKTYPALPRLLQKILPVRPWSLDYDNYSTFIEVSTELRKNHMSIKHIRGLCFGYVWIFNYLPLFNHIKRYIPKVVEAYTKFCGVFESALNEVWPFKYLADRILIYARKQ